MVTTAWMEREDSPVQLLEDAPSVVGLFPEECMMLMPVIETHGLGHACPQVSVDPVVGRYSDLKVGHIG